MNSSKTKGGIRARGKILVLGLALSTVMAFGASAYTAAIGGEFALKIGDGIPNSALLSFRIPGLPPVFGLGLTVTKSGGQSSIVLLADWWLASGNLVGFVNYYVGPGVFLAIAQEDAQFGIRVPVGIDAFPSPPLELFVELAPAAYLLDSSGTGTVILPDFGIQAGFGFRYWF